MVEAKVAKPGESSCAVLPGTIRLLLRPGVWVHIPSGVYTDKVPNIKSVREACVKTSVQFFTYGLLHHPEHIVHGDGGVGHGDLPANHLAELHLPGKVPFPLEDSEAEAPGVFRPWSV